jgi:hypothetical protein
MRRISCIDQRIMALVLPSNCWPLIFFPPAVGAVTDCRQHGKGQHHQRDVAMPAMPGPGFIVVQSQFGLGHLKSVLDRPAMTLYRDQRLHRRAGRTPGREIRHLAITDAAPDQQAPGPQAATWRTTLGGIEIGQFQIRPVIYPRSLGALAGREAPPGRGFEPLGDVFGSAAGLWLAEP